jgi:hypothetical protein
VFASSEGAPQQRSLSIDAQQFVTALHIRAGSLIDGMSIGRSDGQTVRGGGSGGSLIELTWHPNDQETLLGFYGGCGGHLHNIGVVIKHIVGGGAVPSSTSVPAATTEILSADVLQVLFDAHGVTNDVKYINTVSFTRVLGRGGDGLCHGFVVECGSCGWWSAVCQAPMNARTDSVHNDLPRFTTILQRFVAANDRTAVVIAVQTYLTYLNKVTSCPD